MSDKLPAHINPKDLTTFERIRLSYRDDIALTPHEEETKQIWVEAWTMLCKFKSSRQVYNFLRWERTRSHAQAYRDIANAKRMFGEIMKTSKEGERQILYELAMETLKMAKKDGDLDAMNKAISNMIKIKGFDKEDPDVPNFDALQQHVFNIVVDPKAVGLPEFDNLDEIIKKFKEKKEKINLENIDDAEIVQ